MFELDLTSFKSDRHRCPASFLRLIDCNDLADITIKNIFFRIILQLQNTVTDMKFIFPRLYAFGIQSRWIHQRGKRAVQLIDSGGSHVHRCQNLNIIRTLSLLQDNLNDSLRHAADLLATAFYKRTVTGFFQKIRWNFAIYDTARQFND